LENYLKDTLVSNGIVTECWGGARTKKANNLIKKSYSSLIEERRLEYRLKRKDYVTNLKVRKLVI
jgi:hypothetical protein